MPDKTRASLRKTATAASATKAVPKPRILIWDIECSGLRSDFGLLLCIGYKWYGEAKTHTLNIYDYPGWQKDMTDSRKLLKDFMKVYMQADMQVTFNGKMFDVKWINGKLWHYGMPLLPPLPHVDLYFAAKTNLNMSRKSLANISSVGRFKERKFSDFDNVEWLKASVGHMQSLRSIVKHCHADLRVTEEAYDRLAPFIRTHPNTAPAGVSGVCRVCRSNKLSRRGTYLSATKVAKQRYVCKDCGAWTVRDQSKKALVGAWPLR